MSYGSADTTSANVNPQSGGDEQSVPTRLAAGWALGTLGTTVMLNGVSIALLFFLVSFVKIEPLVVGFLLFGSKLLDMVTDPPMGFISDSTRTRFGRRRPYLLGASFFCGLAFALLFNVPELSGSMTYVYLLLALALYALSYTVFQVPYMAMPAEMTDDYHQRTTLMSWRVFFMTIGNMVGFAGPSALASALGNDRAAYGEMGVYFGGAIFVLMLLTFFFTAGARQTQAVSGQNEVPLRQHVQWLKQNRPLLILMSTKIAIYTGISANLAVALFFFASVLKLGGEMFALYAVVNAATSIAFLPVCGWVARRIGKKEAYIVSMLGFCAALLTWLLAQPGDPTWMLVARAMLIGMFGAGAHLFGQSMLMDTFAYDRKFSGVKREGVLSASFSFVEKACMAFGPLIIGFLLTTMGFDKELSPDADQPASAVRAMFIGFIWIPLACQLAAIGLLKFYHLDESVLER
jgi:GPH family glycoside/pentoside/hexuronide:cation symporter